MSVSNNTHTKGTILVITDNTALAGHFIEVLEGEFLLEVLTDADPACTCIATSHPHLVMLDPALFKESLPETISNILKQAPHTRIIVLEGTSSIPVNQMSLFKTGAHGFCAIDIRTDLLVKAAHAVCNGEIWVPRKLITRLIGELARENGPETLKPANFEDKSVKLLTPRELQVARMVHLGGNNKMIARELEISERTVKAHLSAIFRKLEIENRLHLALFFSEIR